MIVLDTHSWVWWANDSADLSRPARKQIEAALREDRLLVSSISVWEVALLVERGRLQLAIAVDEWVARTERVPGLRFVPVNNAIALRSRQLPGRLHKDPADRIIVATALSHGATVVTRDDRIRGYEHVRSIW
ncbi:MAG: type II toxin-antitoxin system VapC family toxin [Gemmatimonadetes bacterium]|nr:type II toxin-antitoxin system VapC family toxin [Gemmatimonadota bacterium]